MPPRGKRSAPEPVQPRRDKALKGIEPEPVPAELGVNAEIQAALSKCDDIILEKWSKGILTDQPTALSGVPEYNAARAKAALDGGNKYTASVPLYWLNLKFEMQPGVPRYRSRIDSLEKHFFESPAHMMAPLTVCLNSGEYPHECIGALNPVDPSELRDALRQAVARAITDKQPAATLRKWRDVLMSTVVEFEVMDDKNRIQKTFSTIVQRREDIGVWHENTRVTSLLRIYEVMDLKRQLEDVSGKQNKKSLAAHYERIKYCQKSEQVTVGWVEVAQMLHGCALQNPVVLKVLTSFDQLPSNPIDTVYKMREICVQSDKRPDHMEWSFVMLWDWWTNCEGCEISQRELKEGSRYPVSLIRLFLAKKSLRDWLWRNMESNFMWESTVKQSIRDVTKDLPTMRRHFGFYDDPSAQVAFADRGSWPESADLYVQLFEAVVYGYRFDHHLGQSLKNHKTADDVFNHSDVKPMMSKVLAAYEKETGSTPDTVEEEVPLDVQTLLAADNVHLSLPESLIKAAEESPGGKDFEGCAAVEAGVRAAQRRVQGQIQLIVDCDEGLADLLRETKAAQMTGDPEAKSYVAVVFDGKVACESGSQAKYRLPPLRQPQLKRLVGAFLALRDGELADGDVFVMLDGGKGPTFEDSVTKVVGKKLQASKTTVVYTFESCEARLERASKQTLDMVETVSMPTHDGFSAKVQPRLFSESNTRGNAIAGLARPQWTDAKAVWNVSMAQKRSILGPTNMPLPGGACPVEHEQESKVKDSDVVPAFYHESPHTLAAELGHYLCVRAIIDLTPGSGHWAAWSVRKRVPYAGVCMTEKHAELLTKRLVTKTVEAMMDPNDEDLYDSAYTALIEKLQGANNQQGVTEAQNQGKGKGRGGRGGRGGKGTGKQRGVQQQDGGAGAADEASSGSGGLSRDELLKKITEAAAAGAADDA